MFFYFTPIMINFLVFTINTRILLTYWEIRKKFIVYLTTLVAPQQPPLEASRTEMTIDNLCSFFCKF